MLNALLTVTASAVGRPPDAVPVPANKPEDSLRLRALRDLCDLR